MHSTTIAVDVAKSVFEIAVSRHPGTVSERHRVPRSHFLEFFAARQPATVILEACGSSHHWARRLQALGHRPVLLPPHAVRPYVPRNKTDRTDAKGLLEAVRNADLHAVPVKSVDQQCLAALHRLRSTWLAARTSRINTVRGILRELGHAVPVGPHHLVGTLDRLLRDPESDIPEAIRRALRDALEEMGDLETKTKAVERDLERLAAGDATVARLRSVPGIGLLTATALVAFVGDARRFRTGRHFASYLGLTPREISSGSIRRLGSISKRGDTYVRMLLTHGARSTLWHARRVRDPDRLRAWALKLQETRGHNRATCALANKLARIAWAVWKNDESYMAKTN